MDTLSGWMLPLGIFVAELTVVTLSTIRIIFVSRGQKTLAACLGFFEILLWLFAIGQIMKNLDSPPCHLAFAMGFTMGNYLGVWLEGVLAMGKLSVEIVSPQDIDPLVTMLASKGYGLTFHPGMGKLGPVQVINTVIRRRDLDRVSDLIRQTDPKAFFAVSEIQETERGVFPANPGSIFSSIKLLLHRAVPLSSRKVTDPKLNPLG